MSKYKLVLKDTNPDIVAKLIKEKLEMKHLQQDINIFLMKKWNTFKN